MPNALLDRLQSLDASKQAALDRADAIMTKVETEKRAAMTSDELAAYNACIKEADDVQATIEVVKKRASYPTNDATSTTTTTRTAGQPAEVHDNAVDRPWMPAASTGESKQARETRMSFGFGEYLKAVRKAATPNIRSEQVDVRLLALNDGYQRRAAAAGASETVPSDGGFLVAPDFASEVLQITHDVGLVYPRVRKLPLSEFTNAIKIPAVDEQSRKDGYRWGGIQGFWEQEAQQLTGAKPTFALLELVTKKLTGLFYATDEVLNDARLLGFLAMKGFSEEFAFKLDDGCIRGTGAGQLLGILNAPCLITQAAETGQLTKTVNYTNLKKMWTRMWGPLRQNAVWMIEQDVEQQLMGLVQEVGVGGVPVYTPPGAGGALFGGATAEPYGRIFGRPVVVIEQAATLGTPGDIILADWGQYFAIDKGDVQMASSMHVRFLTDEMTYRWILRCDAQPWWKTALTPANSPLPRSPFVVLATR